ncbi:MAG: hypothetical protein FH758_10975 [Firmicutes bacterium]|nr:hypothetical protein [Bacillota bacterium]
MRIKAKVAKIDHKKGVMVVFTQDRQFKRMPLPVEIPNLGSTILVNLPKEKSFLNRMATKKWAAAAAVLLMVFAIGMFSSYGISPVSAYVTLDSANSSLQISVNEDGRVENITALNKKGKELIANLNIDNKNIYLAVQEIVKKSSSSGYLDQEKENLVLASVTKIEDNINISKDKLRETIYNEMYSAKYPGYVVVNEVAKGQWNQAQESGYSVNRLVISERAENSGVTINPDSWNNHDYMQVMNDAQLSVTKMFTKDCSKVTWREDSNTGKKPDSQDYSQQSPTVNSKNQWHESNQWGNNHDSMPTDNNVNDSQINSNSWEHKNDSYKESWNNMQNNEHEGLWREHGRGYHTNNEKNKW